MSALPENKSYPGLSRRISAFSRLIFTLLIIFFPLPAWGQYPTRPGSPLLDPGDDASAAPVRASLVAEYSAITPARKFYLAVKLEIKPDWSIYWKNPGQLADKGTTVTLHPPAGFTQGEALWPGPQRLSSGAVVEYIYRDVVLVIFPLQAPVSLDGIKEVTFTADCSWLAMNKAKVPGSAKLKLTLPVAGRDETVREAPDRQLIYQMLEKTPQEAKKADVTLHRTWSDALTLDLRVPGAAYLAFYPDRSPDWVLKSPADSGAAASDHLRLEISFLRFGTKSPVTGVLEVHLPGKNSTRVVYLKVSVPRKKTDL
ncbi:MAG TPA: hypothetical protein ENJ06_03920 [Phycisphaeraceae bacterium]|nr:hypothetical protein [Phycisphaeraceae bacterium]